MTSQCWCLLRGCCNAQVAGAPLYCDLSLTHCTVRPGKEEGKARSEGVGVYALPVYSVRCSGCSWMDLQIYHILAPRSLCSGEDVEQCCSVWVPLLAWRPVSELSSQQLKKNFKSVFNLCKQTTKIKSLYQSMQAIYCFLP